MNGLERCGTVLQGGIPDRVPAGPLVCGASRRVYGVTYEEWSQDGELMAKSQIQAHNLIGYDGILGLIDLSGFDQNIWKRCEALRKVKVPFIVISPQRSPLIQRDSMKYGASGLLVKPVGIKELMEYVHTLLGE